MSKNLCVSTGPAHEVDGTDTMYGAHNDVLHQTEHLSSKNDAYFAVMQSDGNFVVYVSHHFVSANALWASGTHGKGVGPYRLVMQADNNLVVYDSRNQATWASGTHNKGAKTATLKMQSDGNLVIYDAKSQPIWSTNTWRKLKALLRLFGLHLYHGLLVVLFVFVCRARFSL